MVATACFVAAEMALLAVDRDRIDVLAEGGDRRARMVRSNLQRLTFTLSGTQLGVTVASLVLGFVAEPSIARVLEPGLAFLPDGASSAISVALALLVATVAEMVLGELVPKGLSVARPLDVALLTAAPLRLYTTVFGPVITVLNAATTATVRKLGVEPREDVRAVRTTEELAYAMDVLAVPAAERERVPVQSIATEPTYIPEGRDLESLLAEMRTDGVQLAVVLDEYGGVAGILTVEDLLEEIVGDI
ncbi:MAG: DUF21 domain-containing protein, partial [Acidobacteria bacterium]|nr:DUF21 domain-containing protein [Acidobacteriota bacterium]